MYFLVIYDDDMTVAYRMGLVHGTREGTIFGI